MSRRPVSPAATSVRLRELAAVFLRLGVIGFGGPAAHVALMEDECVRRRAWLDRAEFGDLLAAAYLLPGPNSTELALSIGLRRAGTAGLLVAGSCFVLPAALLVAALAWGYVRFGSIPAIGFVLGAVSPVVLAVIVQAVVSLGRSAVRSWSLAALAVGSLAASLAGASELPILAVAGGLSALFHVLGGRGTRGASMTAWVPVAAAERSPAATDSSGAAIAGALAAVPAAFGLAPLFLVFLKIGSVLFGSGYVLYAFLHGDLVERLGWLTERQLVDAIAVGQLTPGPLFTSATFVGYLLAGGPGALAATVGIFLPAFVLVAVSGPWLPRLRRSALAAAALDGLVAASVALMAATSLSLARTTVNGPVSAGVALVALALLVRFRVAAAWLMLGAAVIGGLLRVLA